MANTFEYNAANATGFGRAADIRGIAGLARMARTRFAQYRTYRRTLSELETLSRRELNDLGLNKHALHTIAYDAAYGTAK